MPSADDLASLSRLQTTDPDTSKLMPKFPELPADLVKRFPSLEGYHKEVEAWTIKTTIALRGGAV